MKSNSFSKLPSKFKKMVLFGSLLVNSLTQVPLVQAGGGDVTNTRGLENPVVKGLAGSWLSGAESGSLFYKILGGVLRFMMILGAVLVLINLTQAAIAWIGSGGDSSKVEKARGRMTDAIIGLILLSGSYAIWVFVKNFLGVDLSFTLLTDPG